MTSATGRPRVIWRRGGRRSGFTMIEVMVVMAILALLMGFLVVAVVGHRKRANVEATRALLLRLDLALQKYEELTHSYPPDGLDEDVYTEDDVQIRGSACLHYFLTREIEVERNVAGETRRSKHPPPLTDLTSSELFEDPENPGVYTILDAFGNEIHYDNIENGEFTPQDGDSLQVVMGNYPPDPRDDASYGAVKEEGNQGKGYDLWSMGEGGSRTDELETTMRLVIASWNLGDKTRDAPAEEEE